MNAGHMPDFAIRGYDLLLRTQLGGASNQKPKGQLAFRPRPLSPRLQCSHLPDSFASPTVGKSGPQPVMSRVVDPGRVTATGCRQSGIQKVGVTAVTEMVGTHVFDCLKLL
jgi:hypothetical protein